MSTAADHLTQARENRDFAERLLLPPTNPTNVQWAVVAAFYCAVHGLQAHLLLLGHDPTNHQQRGLLIDHPSSGVPSDIRRSYWWLKQRSEAARYRLGHFAPQFVRTTVLDTHVARIASFVGL